MTSWVRHPYANTNNMARSAYDALNAAQDALAGLEVALDLHLGRAPTHTELPGINRDDLFETIFDLPVYRDMIGRMKVRAAKIVRATNTGGAATP